MATVVMLPRIRPPRARLPIADADPAPSPTPSAAASLSSTTIVEDARVSRTEDSRGQSRERAYQGPALMVSARSPRPRPARPNPREVAPPRQAPLEKHIFGRVVLRIYERGDFAIERADDIPIVKIEMQSARPVRVDRPATPVDAGPVMLASADLDDLLVALDVVASHRTSALSRDRPTFKPPFSKNRR